MEQLDRETILKALAALNERLSTMNLVGDIALYGGGSMVLAFNARLSTQDLDAVFQPTSEIREIAAELANEMGLTAQWINDGVKGWLSPKGELVPGNLPQFSHLRLTRPTTQYLLAMKCLAARVGGPGIASDREDIRFLLLDLQLSSAEEVLRIVEEFYPPERILPKTRFLVEEIIAEISIDRVLPES